MENYPRVGSCAKKLSSAGKITKNKSAKNPSRRTNDKAALSQLFPGSFFQIHEYINLLLESLQGFDLAGRWQLAFPTKPSAGMN